MKKDKRWHLHARLIPKKSAWSAYAQSIDTRGDPHRYIRISMAIANEPSFVPPMLSSVVIDTYLSFILFFFFYYFRYFCSVSLTLIWLRIAACVFSKIKVKNRTAKTASGWSKIRWIFKKKQPRDVEFFMYRKYYSKPEREVEKVSVDTKIKSSSFELPILVRIHDEKACIAFRKTWKIRHRMTIGNRTFTEKAVTILRHAPDVCSFTSNKWVAFLDVLRRNYVVTHWEEFTDLKKLTSKTVSRWLGIQKMICTESYSKWQAFVNLQSVPIRKFSQFT